MSGARRHHVCAFIRREAAGSVIVAAPLFLATLLGFDHDPRDWNASVWEDTVLSLPSDLSDRPLRNVFTGVEHAREATPSGLALSQVFERFPVAILEEVQE